jgi:RNA polymerase sigma factor (sigma-70 family)
MRGASSGASAARRRGSGAFWISGEGYFALAMERRSLARLWRYAVVLSRTSDAADGLVQATCLRAIERADQFIPGTRLDRWLFSILRSIWLNEIRARKIREGGGFVAAEEALTSDGAKAIELNILAAEVFRAIGRLPEAQRETVLLVYGEGYAWRATCSTNSSMIRSGRAVSFRLESSKGRSCTLGPG